MGPLGGSGTLWEHGRHPWDPWVSGNPWGHGGGHPWDPRVTGDTLGTQGAIMGPLGEAGDSRVSGDSMGTLGGGTHGCHAVPSAPSERPSTQE